MDFIYRETITHQHNFIIVYLLFDIYGTTNALAHPALSVYRCCNYVMHTLEMAKHDIQFIDWDNRLLSDDLLLRYSMMSFSLCVITFTHTHNSRSHLLQHQTKIKRRATIGMIFRPNLTTMRFNNFPTNRKTQT